MTERPFAQKMETSLLIGHLAKTAIGQTISYDELSRVAGCPVDGSTGYLHTARRRLQKDKEMVFGTVRAEGITRLDDKAIVDDAVHRNAHVRRFNKETVHRATKINDFGKLPVEYQRKHSIAVSTAATIAWMTSPRRLAKLEPPVPEIKDKQPLPIAQTLAMFTKK